MIVLLILFQIELHLVLNNAMTSCQDFDSLFSVSNNSYSSLSVRSCSVYTAPGEKHASCQKTFTYSNACMHFKKERCIITVRNVVAAR